MHFESVVFRDPPGGAPARLESPMSRDFRAAVHQLDRFGRMPAG
jgi:hypothetical protein